MIRHTILILILFASSLAYAGAPLYTPELPGHGSEWVDSVYSGLSLEKRVGQLFVPKFNPATPAAARASLQRLVAEYGIGGLLLSKGTASQHADIADCAQSLSEVPMLITMDGEWGPAMRVTGAPKFPYNMTLGAIDNPSLLREMGREVARQCRLLGVSMDFAPVLDVNSNPINPVIGYRSFGENPERVATLGTAFALGLEDGGVMSCAKHFPGHGDTSADSHKTLPTVAHTKKRLREVDLVPFRRYAEAGLGAVMVAHLNVPSVDAAGTPTSLSTKAVAELLRGELGFRGIAVTDGLAMKGAVTAPGRNNCVDAILAGNDIVLEPLQPLADIKAVISAVKSGEIPARMLEERVKRVLAMKYALGLSSKPEPSSCPDLMKRLDTPQSATLIRRLNEASVVCLSNPEGILPVVNPDTVSIAVVTLGGEAPHFVDICGKYGRTTHFTAPLTAEKLKSISRHDLIVAVVASDKADPTTLAQLGPGTVKAFLVNPYKLAPYKPLESAAALYIGENTRVAQECLAQAVFGGIRVNGTLPVGVEGVGPEGMGVGLLKTRLGFASPREKGFSVGVADSVDCIVRQCITEGAFPGCQVLVACKGDVVLSRNYGHTDRTRTHAVTDRTLYDLASVSKAAGTLPALMAACDDGTLQLDLPASSYIPGLVATDKAGITVRQLLLHESGMPAALGIPHILMDTATYTGRLMSTRRRAPYTVKVAKKTWGNASARLRSDLVATAVCHGCDLPIAGGLWGSQATIDTLMQRIYSAKLRPTQGMLYSDLNFALLMDANQRATGVPHEKFLGSRILAPVGATCACYRPLEHHSRADIAPTEADNFLRRQQIHGYVHDELAAFSGGIQGNAGLFSNARDLAKICQMWLNGGTYRGHRVLSDKTIREFTTSRGTSRRHLGFDGADAENPPKSPVTPLASPSTYGHIGFTGTCFWIDPERELIFIFLSNRVNPTRDTPSFFRLNPRGRILEAVYRALE